MSLEQELIFKVTELERRLDNLVMPERGWTPHFLTEPYTNTTFDGDSFSTVGAHTKIENTSWSTTIPADAKALALDITCVDTGSATDLYFSVFSTSTATNPAMSCRPAGLTAGSYHGASGLVPCTDGDIWYRCNASGANTLFVWLRVVGYWT